MGALQIALLAGVLGGGSFVEGDTALLNFSGPNCPHCRTMESALNQLEAAGMPIRTINVEQHPEIARRFQITGIPTFVMLVNGKEANRVVGSTTAQNLQKLFPVNLAPPTGDIRGQSPAASDGNFLGDRLGGLFGKGKPSTGNGLPSADPFTPRMGNEVARPESSIEATQPQGIRTLEPATQTASAIQGPLADDGQHADYAVRVPSTGDIRAAAMAASVRIKVIDATGHSMGSGTIIHLHGNEAMIVTCGHIFRDSQGKGRISVDIFHPQPRTVEGKVLEYDLKRDIAIITISDAAGVTAAKVAPEGFAIDKGHAVFSIGCDKGSDPSLRVSQISGVNRYQGPPNLEAKGQPVDGRSGGGLFSGNGQLIGVCNAADPADDEGIYAATATIHWQLAQVGLEELARNAQPAQQPRAIAYEQTPVDDQVARQLAVPLPAPPDFSRPQNSAPTAIGGDTEVICIVRSKSNPAAKNQMFLINGASPELLQQLAANSADPATAADFAMQQERRSAQMAAPAGPLLRGQSRR